MITEVLITVDTEFSIAGAFEDPKKFPPLSHEVVYGVADSNTNDNGLGFLLRTFQEFRIKATFFVEAINTRYFGPEKMGHVVKQISEAGQDIQLHIHPVWAVFEGEVITTNSPNYPLNDSLAGRTAEQINKILQIGFEAFSLWGLPKPRVVRTGSLITERHMFRSFLDSGLSASSSIAAGIHLPAHEALQINVMQKKVDGITEVPVTSFFDLPLIDQNHLKTLQITSCSWPEIRSILLQANHKGVKKVTILTHPFEFFKKDDFRYTNTIRNRINQGRMRKLCAFIRDNPDKFKSANFTDNIDRWSVNSDPYDERLALPTPLFAIARKLHNRLNDTFWKY